MAVQLSVRALLALRARRAAKKEEARAKAQAEAEARGENTTLEAKNAKGKGKAKGEFTVDGKPLKLATFDPEDPESGSPYPPEEEGEDARDQRCTLCLGPRRDSAVTECGHVCEFILDNCSSDSEREADLSLRAGVAVCWECVVGWARDKVSGRGEKRWIGSGHRRLTWVNGCDFRPSVRCADSGSNLTGFCRCTTCSCNSNADRPTERARAILAQPAVVAG